MGKIAFPPFLYGLLLNRSCVQIYWVGPLLGSLLASGFYTLIKALEYETANPGQDFDENETKLFNPDKDVDRPMVNLVSPETASQIPGQSRPPTGDTWTGYRREEVPLEHIKTTLSKTKSQTPPMKGGRRGSSPMTPLGTDTTAIGGSQGTSSPTEDLIHGGAHYSQTANRLDPRVQGGLSETYQAGPDVEAGNHAPQSSGGRI